MISIDALHKFYTGFSGPLDRIIAGLTFGFAGGSIRYQALNDISFSADKGEIIGIIGRNGAGKSTLLKVISGVSRFQKGELKLSGSVRSILELGVGFNPELSGKENVYYNGLVSGYTIDEIKNLDEEIFRFSGLEDFRDTPLKSYSSGMIMRLGFALATAKRSDILLVDEALAVGDALFQQKCINRFRQYQEEGSLVFIVSHDLGLMKALCTRILVMDRGRIVYDGNPVKAYEHYMELIAHNSFEDASFASSDFVTSCHTSLVHKGKSGQEFLPVGAEVSLLIKTVFAIDIPDLTVGFHISDVKGNRIFGTNSWQMKEYMKDIPAGREVEVEFSFPLNLAPGKYSIGIALHEGDSHVTKSYLWSDSEISIEVENISFPKFEGAAFLPVAFSKKN